MSADLLKAQRLTCERDDRHLFSELDFVVRAGELVQVIGPNGAGKTTLLRILAGLYQNFQGTLLWNGEEVSKNREAFNQELLFLGHKSAVNPLLTVQENLSFLASMHSTHSPQEQSEALKQVGLFGYEHAFCQNLSAGQLRRVALARLYLSDAKLWVLDEIFTAIDLDGVAQLERLLQAKAERGVAVIFTTHHQPKIERLRTMNLLGHKL
jgi:heme exporter protein A